MSWKLIGEWGHRIFLFTIFQSLIAIIGFVGVYVSMNVLIEKDLLYFGTQAGLVQMALAIAYLQVANILYFLFDVNLLNVKELWKNKI